MATLVELRPLPVKKWHKKEGKESFARPMKFGALLNAETGMYDTGLTAEDFKKLEEMNFKADLSLYPAEGNRPHPFWDSKEMRIELKNQTMFFNPALPREFIKVRIMRASKFVANSLKEYEDGVFPYATHYIHDEAVDADIEATSLAIRNKATDIFGKLSLERKLELSLILGGKSLKNQTNNFIDVALDKEIQKDPETFIRYAEKEDKGKVTVLALVKECLLKRVLIKEGHKIMYGDSTLGADEDEVANYLLEDNNQELRIHFVEKIS